MTEAQPNVPAPYVVSDDSLRSQALATAAYAGNTGSLTPEEVLSRANAYYGFLKGDGAAKPARAKAKTTAESKPDPKPETKTEPPKQETAAVDVLGDDGNDNFLTDDEPAPDPEKVKKATIEDVRAALLKLQKETDAYTARKVLAEHGNGADTLGKIKPENFQAVINAAVKQGTTKIPQPAK